MTGFATYKTEGDVALPGLNRPAMRNAISDALPRINAMAREDGMFVESSIASFTATSPEAEERLNAFLEKRATKVTAPGGDK